MQDIPEHIKSTEDGNVCGHVFHVKRVNNSEQRSQSTMTNACGLRKRGRKGSEVEEGGRREGEGAGGGRSRRGGGGGGGKEGGGRREGKSRTFF